MPCSHRPIVVVLFWSLGKISKCWRLTELWTIRFWLGDRKTLDNRRARWSERERNWQRLWFHLSQVLSDGARSGAGAGDPGILLSRSMTAWQRILHLKLYRKEQAVHKPWHMSKLLQVDMQTCNIETPTHYRHTHIDMLRNVAVKNTVHRWIEQRGRQAGADARDSPIIPASK